MVRAGGLAPPKAFRPFRLQRSAIAALPRAGIYKKLPIEFHSTGDGLCSPSKTHPAANRKMVETRGVAPLQSACKAVSPLRNIRPHLKLLESVVGFAPT